MKAISGAGTDIFNSRDVHEFVDDGMDNLWKNIWALHVTERNRVTDTFRYLSDGYIPLLK
jgi:hypothetical protein